MSDISQRNKHIAFKHISDQSFSSFQLFIINSQVETFKRTKGQNKLNGQKNGFLNKTPRQRVSYCRPGCYFLFIKQNRLEFVFILFNFRGPPEKPHSGHVVFDRWDLVRFMMQDARTPARTPAHTPARTLARRHVRTHARTHARTRARSNARTLARSHARTRARSHTRARAHA